MAELAKEVLQVNLEDEMRQSYVDYAMSVIVGRALPGLETCVADISLAEDRERLARTFGDVSVLVNNAGIQVIAPFLETTPAQIEHEFAVNLLAPVLLTRAFLPGLLTRPAAAVVNVSSGLALVPKQTASVYCASKAGLHSFSKTLRWQLEGTSVRVFDVLPSVVDTAMTAGRGRAKISPERLAEEFWKGFSNDRFEMRIGLVKLFAQLHRIAPSLVERLIRPGR